MVVAHQFALDWARGAVVAQYVSGTIQAIQDWEIEPQQEQQVEVS
jgi:hypothetical protein